MDRRGRSRIVSAAPVIAACIAAAGATSEDTTLPMLIRYTNEETVVFAVLNGIICSTFVPVLISLCYSF